MGGRTTGCCTLRRSTCSASCPESEIAERRLFELLPEAERLTYPAIQPLLFARVQSWLNRQCGGDELWDVYDADRCPTGRLHRRAGADGRGRVPPRRVRVDTRRRRALSAHEALAEQGLPEHVGVHRAARRSPETTA